MLGKYVKNKTCILRTAWDGDFVEEKEFGSKGKIRKTSKFKKKFLTDTLAKISQNIFNYSFVPEHYEHFFYLKKNWVF